MHSGLHASMQRLLLKGGSADQPLSSRQPPPTSKLYAEAAVGVPSCTPTVVYNKSPQQTSAWKEAYHMDITNPKGPATRDPPPSLSTQGQGQAGNKDKLETRNKTKDGHTLTDTIKHHAYTQLQSVTCQHRRAPSAVEKRGGIGNRLQQTATTIQVATTASYPESFHSQTLLIPQTPCSRDPKAKQRTTNPCNVRAPSSLNCWLKPLQASQASICCRQLI
jgi:hypothetical protein